MESMPNINKISKQISSFLFSQDIFTGPLDELPKTQSVFTLIGGKVVYDAKVLK